jgi:hypothetical protein
MPPPSFQEKQACAIARDLSSFLAVMPRQEWAARPASYVQAGRGGNARTNNAEEATRTHHMYDDSYPQ